MIQKKHLNQLNQKYLLYLKSLNYLKKLNSHYYLINHQYHLYPKILMNQKLLK
jgi:hypothetical protein